jgi:cytochrome c553
MAIAVAAPRFPNSLVWTRRRSSLRVKEFRDGRRPSTIMQQLANGYTDAQIEAAASYLAAQKR